MARYVSMLTLEECVEVFNTWIQDKLKATSGIKLKKFGSDKVKGEFFIGKTKSTATITMNYNELGYCDAVMHAYHRGHADPVHIKRAIEHYGGTDRASNKWIQLSFERWKERQNPNHSRAPKTVAPADDTANIAANEKVQAEIQFQIDKRDYLDNLPGAAVAQYIYKAAQALTAPEYHQNQVVKKPEQHKYIIKKGFVDPKDFFILPNHIPSTNQILKFIESNKFDMPSNPYGFTANDIVERIKNPPASVDPIVPPPEPFDPKRYITPKDIALGVGVMPSMDLHGVITNIQKYLVEPLANGTDKIFGKEAIVRGSFYVFDHETKLKEGVQPKTVLITEGWATGYSLNETLKAAQSNDVLVVVPWNAGQVKNAVKVCSEHYPSSNIMIAADNDAKSFHYANESDPKDYKLIRNTGLQVAIDACHKFPELSNRLSIIVPPVNHESANGAAPLSDFNDIENSYGKEYLHQCVVKEIVAAVNRRQNGIEETPRLIDIYNSQVKYFSEHHSIPLHPIQATGELSKDPYIPETVIKAENEARIKVELEEDELINQMASSASIDFFNVEVNSDIKSDFDKKMEQSARFFGGANNQEPEVTNVVANTLAPTIDAPAEQPIIDPATFTAVLYQSHLFNSFSKIQELDNKQEMLAALEAKPMSMDAANKVMQAMFDTTINPHLPAIIGSVMDDYKNQSFYRDLAEIKALMDDNYIQLNDESMKFMQDTQREVSNNFIMHNQHKGFDDEIAHKLVSQEISEQPIEAKRALFVELRDTLKNLDSGDEAWLQQIKETLLESKQVANNIAVNEKSARADYEHAP